MTRDSRGRRPNPVAPATGPTDADPWSASQPLDPLRALLVERVALAERLDVVTRDLVAYGRMAGWSWEALAGLTGVSRDTLRRRYGAGQA